MWLFARLSRLLSLSRPASLLIGLVLVLPVLLVSGVWKELIGQPERWRDWMRARRLDEDQADVLLSRMGWRHKSAAFDAFMLPFSLVFLAMPAVYLGRWLGWESVWALVAVAVAYACCGILLWGLVWLVPSNRLVVGRVVRSHLRVSRCPRCRAALGRAPWSGTSASCAACGECVDMLVLPGKVEWSSPELASQMEQLDLREQRSAQAGIPELRTLPVERAARYWEEARRRHWKGLLAWQGLAIAAALAWAAGSIWALVSLKRSASSEFRSFLVRHPWAEHADMLLVLLLIMAPAAAVGYFVWRAGRRWAVRRRLAAHVCRRCGYDLGGIDATGPIVICPECGAGTAAE
jgi:hypothetical protein